MTKRIRQLFLAVAALAALALGGAVFAQAQTPAPAAPETTTAPDRDNVQSGDQTTPDTAATAKATGRTHVRYHATRVASTTTDPAGGGTGQSGDQSTPDTGSASETQGTETPSGSETATANDGPGGHADEPGNPTADHQFQGNE